MKLIHQLWYILTPRERTQGAVLLCGLALGALLEAAAVGLIVPFIAVLNDPGLVLSAPAGQWVLAALNIHDPQRLVVAFGSALLGAFIVKSGYLLILYYWLHRYVFGKQASLARRLMTGYLDMPYTFHLQRNSAAAIKTTTETIQRFTSGFLNALLIILGELLVIAALTGLLVLVQPLATFGAVVVLGIPTLLIYKATQSHLAEAGRIAEQSSAAVVQWTEQAISGIKDTLVMGRAAFFIERHGQQAQRLADCIRSMMLLSVVPRMIIDTFVVAAMVALPLLVLAQGQSLQATLPVLGIFGAAAMRLMPSASRIASGLTQARFHYASTEVLYEELRAIEGDVAPSASLDQRPPDQQGTALPFRQSLVLRHVSYTYPGKRQPAIDDVSIEIPRGHWVGFVGPTGAGKTTLIDLILGLLLPTSGMILIDGRDLRREVSGWQRKIGYVPQDIYLIDDSVRRNVAFGVPDAEIDDARIWKALHAAQLDTTVRTLPGGLDAMTGQRGERLSGGERQRLGIARALYGDPEVLIVDEATANLDPETEAAIVDTLARLRGEKTIIVIAHRFSVVKNCDCVYLMKGGRVQNSGALSHLFSTDPAFREFAGNAL
jgi:ABC-type multidrug transport system fused ATPase/permease subunit